MANSVIALTKGQLLNKGRYRINKELNRGGTAVVYGAEDLLCGGSMVALKVMGGVDTVPIKVVRREINFSSSVQHENIVRLLDVFAENKQLVIVWELIEGLDLLDLLNECNGRLPEDMAAFFFIQLLKAVMFMHKNGFCHRDIKAENAMVMRSSFQLKLIDFGVSKHLQSAQTLGVGTPDYMSPEMLQGGMCPPTVMGRMGAEGADEAEASYDAKAVDAWALGVLMYLLVTGKYPFENPAHPSNLSFTVHNILSARITPYPAGTSSGCQALITSLLQTSPTTRQTLKGLMADPWLQRQAFQYAKKVGHTDVLKNLGEYLQYENNPSVGLEVNKQTPIIKNTRPAVSAKALPEVRAPSKPKQSIFERSFCCFQM